MPDLTTPKTDDFVATLGAAQITALAFLQSLLQRPSAVAVDAAAAPRLPEGAGFGAALANRDIHGGTSTV